MPASSTASDSAALAATLAAKLTAARNRVEAANNELRQTYLEIAHSLRTRREACGLRQTAMADLLGCSGSYLCDLEAGRRLWTPTLIGQYLAHTEQHHG